MISVLGELLTLAGRFQVATGDVLSRISTSDQSARSRGFAALLPGWLGRVTFAPSAQGQIASDIQERLTVLQTSFASRAAPALGSGDGPTLEAPASPRKFLLRGYNGCYKVAPMNDEFPFVTELPKRDQKRVKSLWDHLKDFGALVDGKGVPLTLSIAAKLLGVSHQRVCQMIEAGQLEVVELCDKKFVTEHSVLDLAKLSRTSGTRYNTAPGFSLLERSDSRLEKTSK